MTWLPISLKNAAKCDKWYQLQNHSITESLNAKGAWEKLFTSHPRACHISVSNKNPSTKKKIHFFCLGGEREPLTLDEQYPNRSALVLLILQPVCSLLSARAKERSNKPPKPKNNVFCAFVVCCVFSKFVHRPECGRTTRRT